jgi:hypothetical protein
MARVHPPAEEDVRAPCALQGLKCPLDQFTGDNRGLGRLPDRQPLNLRGFLRRIDLGCDNTISPSAGFREKA